MRAAAEYVSLVQDPACDERVRCGLFAVEIGDRHLVLLHRRETAASLSFCTAFGTKTVRVAVGSQRDGRQNCLPHSLPSPANDLRRGCRPFDAWAIAEFAFWKGNSKGDPQWASE